MEKEIIIKPSYVLKDYFKVYLHLYLKKPLIIIFLSFLALIVLFNIYMVISGQAAFSEILTPPFLFILTFPFIILLSIYAQTRRVLRNPKLKEDIHIKFNQNYFEDVGQSFNSKYNWTEIARIVEKKNYFLIYISKNFTKVIRKEDLKENQYQELKALFHSLNVKKSLK